MATVAALLLLFVGVVAGLALVPGQTAKPPPGFDDASARAAGTIPPPTTAARKIVHRPVKATGTTKPKQRTADAVLGPADLDSPGLDRRDRATSSSASSADCAADHSHDRCRHRARGQRHGHR